MEKVDRKNTTSGNEAPTLHAEKGFFTTFRSAAALFISDNCEDMSMIASGTMLWLCEWWHRGIKQFTSVISVCKPVMCETAILRSFSNQRVRKLCETDRIHTQGAISVSTASVSISEKELRHLHGCEDGVWRVARVANERTLRFLFAYNFGRHRCCSSRSCVILHSDPLLAQLGAVPNYWIMCYQEAQLGL